MPDQNLIRRVSVFSDFPDELIGEIAGSTQLKTLDVNTIVFREGDAAQNLYGLLDGEVELSLVFRDKILKADIRYEEAVQSYFETQQKDIVVDTIEPEEIFGWSALIKPNLMTSTATCSKPSRILSLPAAKLEGIFQRNNQWGFVFMEELAEIISRRLKHRTDKLIESWTEAFSVSRI